MSLKSVEIVLEFFYYLIFKIAGKFGTCIFIKYLKYCKFLLFNGIFILKSQTSNLSFLFQECTRRTLNIAVECPVCM
jgi:predicted transporter